MQNIELTQRIEELKKEKNAIILAHCYQNIEIDQVADYVGDSLHLSQVAAQADAEVIIFAGVYFMAETAKILSPSKKVLIPKEEAGCPMADMLNLKDLRSFKKQHPSVPVVCYVNSTAEVKSESDVCCTSANALEIVKSLNKEKVLFVPDKGLGSYINSKLEGTEVIPFDGYCPTHMNIQPEEVDIMQRKYPKALVLVHPECHMDVIKKADFVGSTTQIMKYAQKSNEKDFIIVTEKGVVERLERDFPEKNFYLVSKKAVCKDMKLNTLEDVYNALKNETTEIFVENEVSLKALSSIEKMLKLSEQISLIK